MAIHKTCANEVQCFDLSKRKDYSKIPALTSENGKIQQTDVRSNTDGQLLVSDLQDSCKYSTDFSCDVIWGISILPLISSSLSILFRLLGRLIRVSATIDITITFIFYKFLVL